MKDLLHPRQRSHQCIQRMMLTVLITSAVLTGPAGCGSGSQPTTVVKKNVSTEATSTLTPAQRGEIRREALAVAQDAWTAWETDDIDAMRSLFPEDFVDQRIAQRDAYEAEGRVLHRVYNVETFDVTEINSDGSEASAAIAFTDESYFEEQGTRRPTHAEGRKTATLYVHKQEDESWLVTRFLIDSSVLQPE